MRRCPLCVIMKMVMIMGKDEKTKHLIAEALVEMLHKQPLDLISIKELCDRAKVGRTSFYNNFKSKEDALKYIYRKAHNQVFQDKFKDLAYLCSDCFIRDMIAFFDANSDLLTVLHKWNLLDVIAKYNTEMSLTYVQQCEDETIKRRYDYFVCYSSSSLFNICSLWVLNQKNISAKELFDTIQYFRHISEQSNDNVSFRKED